LPSVSHCAFLKQFLDEDKGSNISKKRQTFACTFEGCKAIFACFNVFKGHTLSAHNVFPLHCDICKKRYKEQATFRNHMETHDGELKYGCDVCDKKFVTRERLFAHRRLHLGKRFSCSTCDFKASVSNLMTKLLK
jgi:hypothetical protein